MFRFIDVLSLYKNLCNFVCFLVDVRFYFKVFIWGGCMEFILFIMKRMLNI